MGTAWRLTRWAEVAVDLLALSLALWMAGVLSDAEPLATTFHTISIWSWPYLLSLHYGFMSLLGVPRLAWRYVSLPDVLRIGAAGSLATLGALVLTLVGPLIGAHSAVFDVPIRWLLLQGILSFLGITALRVLARLHAERTERGVQRESTLLTKRTLLIGAGRAGVLVAKEVAQNPRLGISVVGFVDDDPLKLGSSIVGYRVLGPTSALPSLAARFSIDQVVISIASANGATIRRIVEVCEQTKLPVRVIPGIHEILDDRVQMSRIREVMVEDLLGRQTIEMDLQAIGGILTGKRVLVTGAGGSIGSELCRQVAGFKPQQLILLEQSENSLFYIHSELQHHKPTLTLVPILADVGDLDRVDAVFAAYRPQIVFHAAARKHVPMMELNPGEAVKTNVFGTRCVAEAATRYGADVFVLISTDKAVNPTSVMGAAKRVAELILQGFSERSKTRFATVRFGNVLGSAGSVIPTFRTQIERGGPVTVTHPDMQRYFMTIPEACQLVMQAASMCQGGEIFVLDMGEPVRIVDLARDLIRLSGFSEEDIPIQFTGLRPGEKLVEELSLQNERIERTRHPKIFIGKIAGVSPQVVEQGLLKLQEVLTSASAKHVRAVLAGIVPEMRDWGEPRTPAA